MKIEYPTEEEINTSIAVSIEKAYPNREGLLVYLGRLYRHGIFVAWNVGAVFVGDCSLWIRNMLL